MSDLKFLVSVPTMVATTYHSTLSSALDLIQYRLYDGHECLLFDLENKTTYLYENNDSSALVYLMTNGDDDFEEEED